MTENCKNCATTFTGNFCNHCGQKKYSRINRKYVSDEVQYTFLHMNKGLLYSVKNLLKNPGKMAREYIEGNRVNHYKPILLTFILSGISAFLSYKVIGLNEITTSYFAAQHVDTKMMGVMMSFVASYTSIIMILVIPFFALTTKIAFRKWGQNYYEHIVMNAYIVSYNTLITIIFVYPIIFLFRHSSASTVFTISQISIWILPIILFWFFKGFYPLRPLKAIILRVLAVLGLTIIGYLVVVIIATFATLAYLIMNGINPATYFKPK